MTDTETKPFGGYEFAIRSFWINGTDLAVYRQWVRESSIEPDAGDRFSTSITGRAVSEKDSVCVIGKDRETKEFALRITSDANAKQEWEMIRELQEIVTKNDGTTPELRVTAHVSETLCKIPPTAHLFVTNDDWEIGIKGGWSIECAVPPPVLAQLEVELLAQRARELCIGIEWAAGLVRDQHAPPSFPTSWGLFTITESHGPEPLRGHVKSIGWRVAKKPVALDEPLPGAQEQPQTPQRSVEEDVDRLGTILARHMVALTRACIIGFLAAFALIVIGHFLR